MFLTKKMAAMCTSGFPKVRDVQDVLLNFEKAKWRLQTAYISKEEALKREDGIPKETDGAFCFYYRSYETVGRWFSWSPWYYVEVIVDAYCPILIDVTDRPPGLPNSTTIRELKKNYAWMTIYISYTGIAKVVLPQRRYLLESTDPNYLSDYIPTMSVPQSCVSVFLSRKEAEKRRNEMLDRYFAKNEEKKNRLAGEEDKVEKEEKEDEEDEEEVVVVEEEEEDKSVKAECSNKKGKEEGENVEEDKVKQ